jgi:predicted ATPase
MIEQAKKIVLTGGPGAGKTVVAQEVVRRLPGRFVLVPESATHIYTTLNTRWDKLDLAGRRDAQKQMYLHQLDQEQRFGAADPDKPLLLDRGTIDGAAYWPDGADQFWSAMGTTLEKELARYDQIIFLETAATLGVYDGAVSNDVRFENAAEAIESGKLLMRLWGSHPRVRYVGAFADLEHKIRMVVDLLK